MSIFLLFVLMMYNMRVDANHKFLICNTVSLNPLTFLLFCHIFCPLCVILSEWDSQKVVSNGLLQFLAVQSHLRGDFVKIFSKDRMSTGKCCLCEIPA